MKRRIIPFTSNCLVQARQAGASMPGSWGLTGKKSCRSSPHGRTEPVGQGEPSNEVGQARTHWVSQLGEPVLGEPSNEVGASHQTRLGRAVKRGWGEPSNEVGRAIKRGWASHSTLSLEGVSQMVYILPERLPALVRPAFDLVLRRIRSLKRCVQA